MWYSLTDHIKQFWVFIWFVFYAHDYLPFACLRWIQWNDWHAISARGMIREGLFAVQSARESGFAFLVLLLGQCSVCYSLLLVWWLKLSPLELNHCLSLRFHICVLQYMCMILYIILHYLLWIYGYFLFVGEKDEEILEMLNLKRIFSIRAVINLRFFSFWVS